VKKILLASMLAVANSARSQILSIGVKGGIPATDAFERRVP
jgi:hypothetical protein